MSRLPSQDKDRTDESFRNLYDQCYRAVLSFFRQRGCDVEESRDLTQETFLRLYRQWPNFRGESSARTFLFRIAANVWSNRLRAENALKRNAEEVSLESETEIPDSGQSNALGEMVENEMHIRLREALDSLSAPRRRRVTLHLLGYKYDEIAQMTGATVETVRSDLFRVRKALREMLAPTEDGSAKKA